MGRFYAQMDAAQRRCFSTIIGADTRIFSAAGGGLHEYAVIGPILRSNTLADINNQRRSPAPQPHLSHATPSHTLAAAHEKSATGLHASAWMCFGNGELSGRDFAYALQLRCMHWPTGVRFCTCGHTFSDSDSTQNFAHLMICNDNTYTYQGRHEEIVTP